ncbi:tyrosine-protein phosphatase [Lactobacillus sp. M0396]|uniref:tyrosine-protein phosphatase n=1 Tax=Lactobacillus sp. M0396 TaxID=2751030 RepID=UPI0018DE4D35|nr:tyrosine-protein phosphatase [Lactobacillus sp. M0396]MBI0032950.1 tyrosine-protein phosphatase [Lactobacillus sp. M0396]
MEIDYAEAYVLDNGQTEIDIKTSEQNLDNYELYWTLDNDRYTRQRKYLLTSNKCKVCFQFAYSTVRPTYFILNFKNYEPLLFGYRILPVPGMYNLRDIGGYRTTDGMRIKWGQVYRSDYLHNLQPSGYTFVKNLGLHSIIDFRSSDEVKETPNPVIDPEIHTFNFDPNAQTAAIAGKAQNLDTGKDMKEKAKEALVKGETGNDQMIRQQESFVNSHSSIAAFSNTIKVTAQSKYLPSLQHCRGGKDRTGFAFMVLEGILGVPQDLLVYDYMLTKKARAKKNARYYQKFLEQTGDKKIADYMYSLFDTKEEFITASITKIMREYGSIYNYATVELRLTETEYLKLHQLLLEKA